MDHIVGKTQSLCAETGNNKTLHILYINNEGIFRDVYSIPDISDHVGRCGS